MAEAEHVIITGRNGELDGTTPEQVAAILEELSSQERIVLHFHGGLVDRAGGLATAERLAKVYSDAGAYPVFMVWQSGLLEVLRHNLDEIVREDLFKRLLRRVLQFSVGKLWQDEGQRAAGALPVPKDVALNGELAKRESGAEPYAETSSPASLEAVSEDERQQLELAIQSDPSLQEAVEQVLADRQPETAVEGSRGVVVRREASASSLIDPEVLDEIDPGGGAAGERGVISTLAVAKKAGAVLVRVISRFRANTDHGVYPTVVEELLREFYLANAGGAVWAAMKKETLDTFGAPDRGGRLVLDALAEGLQRGDRPQITLVGHSTGAVYIDNLLEEVAKGRTGGYRPWPDDAGFRVILLAPAATYASFTTTLGSARELVDELLLFTMTDEAEQADRLAGAVYPRSLLYFVSGVVERDDAGSSAVTPLIGMSRYRGAAYADVSALRVGRDYLTEKRVVLSPTVPGAAGLQSGATSHTAFDEDPQVLASLAQILGTAP